MKLACVSTPTSDAEPVTPSSERCRSTSRSTKSTSSPKLRHLSQVFWRRALGVPAPDLQTRCLISRFGWHTRSSNVMGLRRSGWRRSVDHDHRSLRELDPTSRQSPKSSSAPCLTVRRDASDRTRTCRPQPLFRADTGISAVPSRIL